MTQLLGAIASEQHSLAFYAALSAQYPFFAPFVNAQNAQLKALSFFAPQSGLAQQQSPNIAIPTTQMLALESALAHESAKIAFYNNLAANEPNLAIRDVFFQIAARSHNDHLPAIRNALAAHYTSQNVLGDLLAGIDLLQDAQRLAKDAQAGTLSEEKLASFLGNLNVAMLGGVLLGGAVVALCNHFLNQNKE
ncbi:MAG: hypothetical protein K2N20_05760 [Helicobacter sp.]|nr:hypothetical protein [Helicobacter sp.]